MRAASYIMGAALVGLLAVNAQATPTGGARPMFLKTDTSEALLEQGRRHLFAFRMAAARVTFRRLQRQPDGQAAALYQLATVALFKGLVTDDPAHFETFLVRADSLEGLLDERPPSPWRRQMEATSDLQRTIAAGKLQQYIRAAMAARSAYNGFEALVQDAPRFAEAYMGMGLLHLTVASLPAGYRRLLSILGFGGTAEQGIRELKHAAARSRFNQELAHMSIALADIMLRDRVRQGRDRLARLYEQDPESLLYAHLYGYALYTNREAQQAEAVLKSGVEKQRTPSYFYIDYLDYYLGEAHFVQNAFAAAEVAYRRYLRRHDGPALRAMGYYRLGLALEMQGRRAEAVRVYQDVEAARDFDNDLVAARRAQIRIEHPMTAREKRLIRSENAFLSRQHDKAERMLRSAFHEAPTGSVHRARAAFYLGRLYHVQGEYEQAHPAYQYAIQHPGSDEAEWGPWAQLYMAEMYADQGKTQAATQAYRTALNWDTPFDYYRALEQRARIALERLPED